MNILSRSFWFNVRIKTWPLRIWLFNLSWVPLWWLRKHVHPRGLSWTPAATIRQLTSALKMEEENYKRAIAGWQKTEQKCSELNHELFKLTTTDQQKKMLKETMGIDLIGDEPVPPPCTATR